MVNKRCLDEKLNDLTFKQHIIVEMSFLKVLAVGKPNCLKNNPGILDGEFTWYNKQNLPWEVQEQEVTTMIRLFSTRFRNAYSLNRIENG